MQRFPRTATNIITAITGAAWVIAVLFGQSDQAAYALGFIPLRVTAPAALFPSVPVYLTPLTATLVHSNLVHLGFNLLILVWCGTQVERIIGAGGLVVLYVIGAFAAAAAQWGINPHGTVPMIGASGAISAVMGAFALSYGRARPFTNNLAVNRWINVVWLMGAWIVLQVMMGWLGNQQGYLLATPAHVGGFAAGLLLQRPLLLWRYRNA
ncbi:rhomboid family intramembrane serine protease [Sphingomonas agri]|uniref:rhomboid family intramembrane serine protease n=1 Tax=Sphingomonas agri TaxID=1813878 RepID=UPI00311EA59E